jgi:hypothetical protein
MKYAELEYERDDVIEIIYNLPPHVCALIMGIITERDFIKYYNKLQFETFKKQVEIEKRSFTNPVVALQRSTSSLAQNERKVSSGL